MKTPKIKKPSKAVLKKIHGLENHKGEFAAIEPKTGAYFLGETLTTALKKAIRAYPGKTFYCIRIGFPYAHQIKALRAA